MSNLKPCPLCGGRCEHDYDDDGYHWVYCTQCGLQSDTEVEDGSGVKDVLTNNWNKRPCENKLKADAVRDVAEHIANIHVGATRPSELRNNLKSYKTSIASHVYKYAEKIERSEE